MNSRIKLVSDTEVRIQPAKGSDWVTLAVNFSSGLTPFDSSSSGTDKQGINAFTDILQCLKHTGSFAALSDESAVPYPGKKMRTTTLGSCCHYVGCFRETGGDENHFVVEEDRRGWWVENDGLLPLTEPKPAEPDGLPCPTVRPWAVAEEVWTHLYDGGQWAVTPSGKRHRLCTIRPLGLAGISQQFSIGCWNERDQKWFDITPEEIVKWKLESTGKFCGVVEEPKD